MKPDKMILLAFLKSIREDLVKAWKRIVAFPLLTFLIVMALLSAFLPLQYAVKATIGVNHAGMSTQGISWSEQALYDNYKTAAENASRVKNVLESKAFQTAVAAELGLDSFEGSVSAVRKGDSSLLEIIVKAPHAGTAYQEACLMVTGSSELSSYLAYGLETCVLKEPEIPQQFEDPFQNIRAAFLAALSILIILIFETSVRSCMRDTIRSASDIALKTGMAALAVFDPAKKVAASKSVQRLARRILHRMDVQADHVLLMAGAAEREDCAEIAFNTARCMAQIGRKVVLVTPGTDEYKVIRIPASRTDTSEMQQKQDFTSVQWCKIPALIQEIKDEESLLILDVPYCGYMSAIEEASAVAECAVIVIGRHGVEASFINDLIDVVKQNSQILGGVFYDKSGKGKRKEHAGKA